MSARDNLKKNFPGLYRFLLGIYRITPLYDSGLKKDLAIREKREQEFLRELFPEKPVVCAGPFTGLQYLDQASGSVLLPKLLGTYECSLQSWIGEAQEAGYDTFLDIGCAEGYYAVGLALTCPTLKVVAYDLNPTARDLCREMAELNGVSERVIIKEKCDAQEIESEAKGKTLIICDIEGAELDLLNPETAPILRKVDLIVEAHDHLNPEITPTLLERFKATHEIETVSITPPPANLLKPISHLSEADQSFILDEQRTPKMVWHRFRTKKGKTMNHALADWVEDHLESLEQRGIIAEIVFDEINDGGYHVIIESDKIVGHILYWPKRTEIIDTYEVHLEDKYSDRRILLEEKTFSKKSLLENYLYDLFFKRLDILIQP